MGNDSYDREGLLWIINFNPRSRVGNDEVGTKFHALFAISIHVPAWGTTFSVCQFYDFKFISIHVPAWGTTTGKITYFMS